MYNWKNKTDADIVKIVVDHDGRLVKKRHQYEDLFSLITQVFRPRRFDILGLYKDKSKGKRYGAKLYDQNPSNSLNKYVFGKIGYMMSRSIPWIQFVPQKATLQRVDHITRYLQDSAEQVLYAARQSNILTWRRICSEMSMSTTGILN
jgi:hypothetical protein